MLEEITAELRRRIYAAVDRERDYQDIKWAGKPHTVGNWILILEGELDEAKKRWQKSSDDDALREILQIVAVGVACIEQHGIVERRKYEVNNSAGL